MLGVTVDYLSGSISIHAPPRGATDARRKVLDEKKISIHAPPRGATRSFGSSSSISEKFQFTPLREGRLVANGSSVLLMISIHAPPRGATTELTLAIRSKIISIHAPPRGATGGGVLLVSLEMISIHAPPRGATFVLRALFCNLNNFNSRPSARGDSLTARARRDSAKHFNSRPSARGDRSDAKEFLDEMISIHAPPRGATRLRRSRTCLLAFQFTPLREGRHL